MISTRLFEIVCDITRNILNYIWRSGSNYFSHPLSMSYCVLHSKMMVCMIYFYCFQGQAVSLWYTTEGVCLGKIADKTLRQNRSYIGLCLKSGFFLLSQLCITVSWVGNPLRLPFLPKRSNKNTYIISNVVYADSFIMKIFVLSDFERGMNFRHQWMKDFNTKYFINSNSHLKIRV